MSKRAEIVRLRRKLPSVNARIALWTRAGGRCEFDNCNHYLLKHHVTHGDGNFAQLAHIVAFSAGGPRGESDLSTAERDDPENLMLLCPICHKHIDDQPDVYTVKTLQQFKRDHEARIYMLTEAKADKETAPLVLRCTIGDSPVAISVAEMQAAVAPFYLNPSEIDEINLTAGGESRTNAYWEAGTAVIRERVARFLERARQSDGNNISVFAMAPIPFLVVLGSCLSNKIPTALFQRHRDADDWAWKESGQAVDFECRTITAGTNIAKVALVFSVSGSIPVGDYRRFVDDGFAVYEIAPKDIAPGLDIMQTRASLAAFRSRYRDTLQRMVRDHGGLAAVHVLPALPAPAAVAVGLDWMRKAHPTLVVYDKRGEVGFEEAIQIRYDEKKSSRA